MYKDKGGNMGNVQDYIDKYPELVENYSKSELESMYQRYNNSFY